MNVLALDTSGPACSVAVLRDGRLAYEARAVNKLTHSRSLMPMVQEALQKAGISVSDISLLAAVTGPGSFTGVRLGVGAAQGMARGLGIRCVGINALEAMARSLYAPGAVVAP
ncbi:MAG TPA: tRNA (adenosine(37)-N6)-threonylcarbamoyltransferase complex dimerization subunit type 1 TsaB, partial [Candidatus Limnocylindria bacterium]|nr:tRNA (adenosine(37)-N6)-threonylcarbamoyltransferase complex dimerization subunit type 1 TsaB [Candidatus Limnocylindria bacterium]